MFKAMSGGLTATPGSEPAYLPALFQYPLRINAPTAVAGDGSYVILSDGRRILDADGAVAVNCLGHGHQRVVEAIARQVRKLSFVWSGTFGSAAAEALAEELVGDHPGGLSHVFFASSGSEAVEASIKLARQYFLEIGEPDRSHIVSRKQSFHGVTLGALNVSGHPARRKPYAPFLSPHFVHVSPCFPFHYQAPGESEAEYVARLKHELEQEFERVGPTRVAAFLAETVPGSTIGAVPPPRGYFKAVREVCDRYGALLILDEIMCGMGRTGVRYAWAEEGVAPDIMAIGKALGAGYVPISATVCSHTIAEALADGSGGFVHGHTYQAHPLACAAALEVQNVVRGEGLLDQVKDKGEVLRAGLREQFANAPWFGDVRGRGLLIALEIMARPEDKTSFAPELMAARRLKIAALKHGLSVFAASGTVDGVRGDHILLAPPFNISDDELSEIIKRLSAAATEALDPLLLDASVV